MKQVSRNSLLVFKEGATYFGLLADEYDTYLPLNQLSISPHQQNDLLWDFHGKQSKQKGCFTNLAMLFGYADIRFSQSGVIFLKRLSTKESIGLLVNEFITQIVNKKTGFKKTATYLSNNIPPALPQSVFHFIQRHQRKNILVINPEKLRQEYPIVW